MGSGSADTALQKKEALILKRLFSLTTLQTLQNYMEDYF